MNIFTMEHYKHTYQQDFDLDMQSYKDLIYVLLPYSFHLKSGGCIIDTFCLVRQQTCLLDLLVIGYSPI